MVEQHTTNFQPSNSFVLGAKSTVSAADLSLVFNLYLPFLGPKAYALYQFLVEEERAASGVAAGSGAANGSVAAIKSVARFSNHYLILDSLSMSAPDFIRSRQALEAVGLLKSYAGKTMGEEAYRYVLLRPLSAAAFFKEDLLSGLLYHYVGEDRYLALGERYASRAGEPLNEEVDQSASFLKVFGMPEGNGKPALAVEEGTGEARENFAAVGFDFAGMAELVHGTTAAKLEKERDFIMTQQVLYGLNESELATALTRSINLDDHELNKPAFLGYLSSHWQNQRQSQQMADLKKAGDVQTDTPGAAETTSSEGNDKPQNSAANAGGNSALQRLYAAANSLSPMDFIGQIKEQNRGYVTNNETRILNDLIDHKTLPLPAINILIYQVLVNMDQPDLKRNLVDAIANAWAKAGVSSAEGAVAAIKAHQQKSQQGASQGSRSNGRTNNWSKRPAKKEPAFAKNEQKQDNVDQKAIKQALDQMKKYKTKD